MLCARILWSNLIVRSGRTKTLYQMVSFFFHAAWKLRVFTVCTLNIFKSTIAPFWFCFSCCTLVLQGKSKDFRCPTKEKWKSRDIISIPASLLSQKSILLSTSSSGPSLRGGPVFYLVRLLVFPNLREVPVEYMSTSSLYILFFVMTAPSEAYVCMFTFMLALHYHFVVIKISLTNSKRF